ncbi:ras-related protein Rap-2c-like [Ischnura elegans]|uniref:ras-related protein Rap-2c-like n=1 Tax=Ischnura elegans TaxID=197161 RepID=UPI001ED8A636|nr:ras-related protein Rap-2c-like [Ischnura elegans]
MIAGTHLLYDPSARLEAKWRQMAKNGHRWMHSASQCTTTTNGSIGEDTDSFPERGDDGFGVEPASYRVVMLGASGVGKTALTTQFTTSEYMCAYDASLDDEYGKKTVSVMLNGEESELEIVDHPASEMSVESYCTTYNPDVFVVVYSITDRESLERAEDILSFLSKADLMATKAVILVGNKTDLERSRVITTSGGRYLANKYECKFIEASGGIDHNVDELLVGILAQAKLNASREQQRQARQHRHQRQQRHLLQRLHHRHSGGENNNESDGSNQQASSSKKARKKQSRMGNVGGGGVAKAQRILNKLLRMDSKSRSCENLHVL